jgi:hypothetical protein
MAAEIDVHWWLSALGLSKIACARVALFFLLKECGRDA